MKDLKIAPKQEDLWMQQELKPTPTLNDLYAAMMRQKDKQITEPRKQMTDFKVEQSGWYRTRDGRDAEVVINLGKSAGQPVVGYIIGETDPQMWASSGKFYTRGAENSRDLVEYLGKERPKQPRKHKVKIHLYTDGTVNVDYGRLMGMKDFLASQTALISETREIEWEVPDNG